MIDVQLEEYKALRTEISELIVQGDRWFQYAIALSVAIVGGALTAANSEAAAQATPLLLIVGSTFLGLAALMYLRADIKRARVLKYIGDELAPALRKSTGGDDSLMSWHSFSRSLTDDLRQASKFSLDFISWGFLGRTLVFSLMVAGAFVFWAVAAWTLTLWASAPEGFELWLIRTAASISLSWLVAVCTLSWAIRKRPGKHGG